MLIFSRILKFSLAAGFVVGAVMLLFARQDHAVVKVEYDRLTKLYGEMPTASPDHFHILRLPTDQPWHFEWRLQKPENLSMVVETRNNFGGGQSSGRATLSPGSQFDSIFRFRLDPDGPQMRAFLVHPFGSSASTFGNAKTSASFREHWAELEVQTTSLTAVERFSADKVIDLVRVTAPEQFSDGTKLHSGPDGVCLLIRIGTQEAFDQEQAAAGRQP